MLESSGQLGLVAGSHLALYGSSETGGQLVEGGGGREAGDDPRDVHVSPVLLQNRHGCLHVRELEVAAQFSLKWSN